MLLFSGYRFIRARNVAAHRACQIAALDRFATLSDFVSHLSLQPRHDAFSGHRSRAPDLLHDPDEHTILAIVIVPLVALTFYRAFRQDFARHRRIARITLPLWLYVSITGVIVYLMLYQIYPS